MLHRRIDMKIDIWQYISEDTEYHNKLYIEKNNLLEMILNEVQRDNPDCEVEYDE